jgi:predicted nucleotidyltransferase
MPDGSPVRVEELRVLAVALATTNPGLDLVALFGSTAAGIPRADSDVDIALLGGAFWKDLELGAQLAALLGREPHVVDLAQASDALRFEIARTGVMLWQREPDGWALFQARTALLYFDLAPLIERCAAGVRDRLRREAAHG